MKSRAWQSLLALETRDIITNWHNKICNEGLNARRAKEITSAAKQAREFFRNAASADNSVKPLLSFYGVSSLSRAALLLLKKGGGEATLKQGHGLTAIEWPNTLSGDISNSLKKLSSLKVRSANGLFSELLEEMQNLMCLHVRSSQVDWGIIYPIPAVGTEITLGELTSRLPDLANEHHNSATTANYAYINNLTCDEQNGFSAVVYGKNRADIRLEYEKLGYETTEKNEQHTIKGSLETFKKSPPQFMHAYTHKPSNPIPMLYLAKPFNGGQYYSQIASTYLLSYYLGMLARYFPTHWVSLYSAEKRDSYWPEISAAQHYIEDSYPELILELIHYTLYNT